MEVSVSNTVAMNEGLYVPFRGVDREASAVGTLHVVNTDTGDGSGGVVTLVYTMTREMFGFHPIFVPTRVLASDDQASATTIRLFYDNTGNERLTGTMFEHQLAVTTVGNNAVNFSALSIPIEPQERAATAVLSIVWTTNTNAKVYNGRVFGVMYDAEALSRRKGPGVTIDQLMAGIR